MTNNWGFYSHIIEGELTCFAVDMGISERVNKDKFLHHYRLKISLKDCTDEGMPSDKEEKLLNKLTYECNVKLNAKGYLVGYITASAERFFYFYCSVDVAHLEELIGPILSKYDYSLLFDEVNEEEPWHFYSEFLLPDIYEAQQVSNRELLRQLKSQGDSLKGIRRTDHWIYFSKASDSSNFINGVKKLGFTLENQWTDVDEDTASKEYVVHIYRNHSLDETTINEVTSLIIELSLDYDGDYEGWETEVVED